MEANKDKCEMEYKESDMKNEEQIEDKANKHLKSLA